MVDEAHALLLWRRAEYSQALLFDVERGWQTGCTCKATMTMFEICGSLGGGYHAGWKRTYYWGTFT
jgi:hypothetical protein